jgi:hypothetical protein
VAPNQGKVATSEPQHLHNHRAELAITNHGYSFFGPDMLLLHNFERCGKWFHKNSSLIADACRYLVQAMDRQAKAFSHRAIAPINAKGRAVGAMGRIATEAGWAAHTGSVDLTNYTPMKPACIGAGNYSANKFMAQYTLKGHIAMGDLNIGVTDSH